MSAASASATAETRERVMERVRVSGRVFQKTLVHVIRTCDCPSFVCSFGGLRLLGRTFWGTLCGQKAHIHTSNERDPPHEPRFESNTQKLTASIFTRTRQPAETYWRRCARKPRRRALRMNKLAMTVKERESCLDNGTRMVLCVVEIRCSASMQRDPSPPQDGRRTCLRTPAI